VSSHRTAERLTKRRRLAFCFFFLLEDVFVGSTRRSTGPPPFLPSDAAALVR